jgi:hypothetical protein
MMSRRLFALLCACAFPVFAQTTYVPSAPTGSATDAMQLNVARSENEVLVSWVLPNGAEIKRIEIYRNTSSDTKGRGRAATVRIEPAVYIDQVTDLNVTYWYWLKLTLANDQVVNVGPVATPPATVWTP